ncbi:MAG: type III pantothenate kinase [Muribaculaceae bacterium]|nr:type III pantothenate kinase [Muribaculaceae bacterium]
MAYYLTIDQGNSEAKMALWEGSELVDFSMEPALTPTRVSNFLGGKRLRGAIYCSVAREDVDIVRHLRHIAPLALRLTPDTPLPITIAYRTPATLGADRVAAAVGAWSDYAGNDILVVDAGTAVTFDYVDREGVYRGGNIAPGISMELRSLHEFTRRLPLIPFPEDMPALCSAGLMGRDTREAISLGVVYAVLAQIDFYRRRLPEGTVTVLGGGCGHHLASVCGFDVKLDEHLVSKGLNRILLYNEK